MSCICFLLILYILSLSLSPPPPKAFLEDPASMNSSSKPHGGHCIDTPINLPQVQALETRIRNELITLGLFEPEEDTKVGGITWSHDADVGSHDWFRHVNSIIACRLHVGIFQFFINPCSMA